MTFALYYMGAEQQGWARLLEEAQVPLGVSFRGLIRRMPKTKPYVLAERLPEGLPLLLDSGAHSFNTAKVATERKDLLAFAQRYEDFVEANADRPTLITEFDALPLGRTWIEDRREEFYHHLDPAKFMPIWHPEWGLDSLRDMAATYEVIGLTTTESLQGSNLTPILHQVARAGVRLHGVAMTKPDLLRTLPFTSASSSSWLSPIKYGDTIVWDGATLHRYPRDYKDRARRQHKMLFERAGFDAEKIQAGDANEVARFTVWSWKQQTDAISRMRRPRVPRDPFSPEDSGTIAEMDGVAEEPGKAAIEGSVSAIVPRETLNPPDLHEIRTPATRGERASLPVIGIETLTHRETVPGAEGEEDQEIVTETALMRSSTASGRICDNCYLSDVCPLFQPHHECAYDIPVEARTAEQRRAIMEGVIELQVQRVAFMKFAEDRMGGHTDPNLSTEIDRLFKLIAVKAEVEDTRDSFEMTVRARGQMGMLDRVFGQQPGGNGGPRHPVIEGDPLRAIDARVPMR